jgi:hypothetical protein
MGNRFAKRSAEWHARVARNQLAWSGWAASPLPVVRVNQPTKPTEPTEPSELTTVLLALDNDPPRSLGMLFMRRGNIYMTFGKPIAAIAEYKQAIGSMPGGDDRVRVKLAEAYRSMGQEELALEYETNPALSVSPTLLDWEFLPVGWWRNPAMAARIEENLDKGQARLLMERLDFIESCQPRECFMSSFSRDKVPYYAYLFERCVIAENPLEGNAIYVIKGIEKWQSMLHLDKRTLRTRYADRVTRVVHRGDWKHRLRDLIRTT